uniref:Glucagon receptor n=1 Tax=Malurus cyaneus samueli TaxID=2593467 RepID=A0A8C5UAX1_9PASS
GGMSQPRILTVLVLLLCCQGHSGQITDNLYERWMKYSEECQRNMSRLPAPTELVCNRTFDKFSCWPDTMPNSTASVPCPWFLPWYQKVKHGHVFKTCGPDGQWVTGPQGQSLRNATQCEQDNEDLKAQEKFAKTYGSFKVMYTVGYSVSLCALLLALALLLGFSKLHCMRNYIHMNLFASFILKGVSVLVIDALLKTHYSDKIDGYNVQVWAHGCAALQSASSSVNLLVVAVFSERSYFTLYLCIGWGAPMLFLIPWVIVKFLYENIQCWSTNNNMGFWWILRFPVFLAILINFFIFIRIIQILVSKLRAHQMRYTDYKFRLAKSTLTLIPLLGIHEVVFAFVTDEHAQGTLRYVKLFFDLFLSSFQVSPALAGPGPALHGDSQSQEGLDWGLVMPLLPLPGHAGGHSLLLRQQGGEWESRGTGSRARAQGMGSRGMGSGGTGTGARTAGAWAAGHGHRA